MGRAVPAQTRQHRRLRRSGGNMRRSGDMLSGFAAAVLSALLFAAYAPLCRAESYGQLAEGVSRAAAREGAVKIVLENFTARDGASAADAEDARLRVQAELKRKPGLELVDKSAGKKGGAYRADGSVYGLVWRTPEGLGIVLRLLDVSSGELLGTAWAVPVREADPGPPAQAAKLPFPADLRDSPGGSGDGCDALMAGLEDPNEDLLDLKARYWAFRMRQPGYAGKRHARKPGAELAGPAAPGKFKALLKKYYKAEAAPELTEAELRWIISYIREEAKAIRDCEAIGY